MNIKNRKSLWVVLIMFFSALLLFSCGVSGEGDLSFAGIDLTYAVETVVMQLSETVALPTQAVLEPTQTSTFYLPIPTLMTNTPVPQRSFTPTATSTIPPCDLAEIVMDVTVPQGVNLYPDDAVNKTWRLRNIGSCEWSQDYALVFVEGDRLSGVDAVSLPGRVIPFQEVDISIPITAPDDLGRYRSGWRLRNPAGQLFSQQDGRPFYINIAVISPQSKALIYSFAGNYCSAEWFSSSSGINTLTCPGSRDDDTGYVILRDNVSLEDDYESNFLVLETHPTWQSNPLWDADQDGGWIRGVFPPVTIPAGAHFKTQLGCIDGATTCDVNFVLQIRIPGLSWQEMGSWPQKLDRKLQDIDINLIEFVGLNVEFQLYVDANGNGGLDQAVWVYPRIER